jgi:preprotein translocase subunit SecG
MLVVLFTLVHVIVCVFLIVVVLLQSGKAADLAGAFGGMGSQTAFGPRGSATLLSKATTISAILFMVTSLSLSILATRDTGAGSTVLENVKAPPATQQKKQEAAPKSGEAPKSVEIDVGGKKMQVPVVPNQAPPAPAPQQNKK